jgi:hypothetical protein
MCTKAIKDFKVFFPSMAISCEDIIFFILEMEKRKKIDITIVLLIPNWLEECSLPAVFSHGKYEIQRKVAVFVNVCIAKESIQKNQIA